MPSKHREYRILAAQFLRSKAWCDVVAYEMRWGRRGVVDAIGVRSAKTGRSQATSKRRIQVVEVKVSRPDLLQDLRKRKMLKYAKGSSHCVLAVHVDCFKPGATKSQILTELNDLGLPDYWGVWLMPADQKISAIRSLRRPKALAHITTQRSNYVLIKMARSLSARVMDKNV